MQLVQRATCLARTNGHPSMSVGSSRVIRYCCTIIVVVFFNILSLIFPCMLLHTLAKPHEHQDTKRNETRQNDPVPPLLTPNPTHQIVDSRQRRRRQRNPPIHTRQRLPLNPKILVDLVRLADDPIDHAVRVIEVIPLLKHVLSLLLLCGP